MSTSTFIYLANRSIRAWFALTVFLLAVTAVQARDWVDFTVAGCKVLATDEPLENFPVAVRISTARIKGFRYSDIASTNDLLFSSLESKDPYPFEVETWNPAGESVIWVRLPSLRTNTQFRMSFNLPPNRPKNPDATNVWSTAAYRGVWHMADYDDSASPNLEHDSSGNGFAATYASGTTRGVSSTAAIGKAFYWSGTKTTSTDGVTTPNLTSTLKMNWYGSTLSGWSYWKGFGATGQHWFFYINTSSSGSYYWGANMSGTKVCSKFSTNSPGSLGLNPASGWFHWTIRVNNRNTYDYFLNGQLIATRSESYKFSSQSTTSLWRCGGTTGYLDEYRFRNAASSDAWILAEYDSIKNANFVVASEVHRGGKLILYLQ